MPNKFDMNTMFNIMKEGLKESSPQTSNNENNSPSFNKAIVKEFEMKVGLDQTYGPPTVEDYKVVQYVTYIYYTMYPTKRGDVYPSNWKDAIVYGYQKIREARAKIRKSSIKDGMKVLRLHIVVGTLLYCILIQDNIAIPVPIFLKYLNNALKEYLTKTVPKEINVQTFERYRTESKPKGIGIKPYLKKGLPGCFKDVEPEEMIEFTGFSLLKLKRNDVYRAKRIAKQAKRGFLDTEPPSYIAIASLYIVSIQNGHNVTHDNFGISEYKLNQSVHTLLKYAEFDKKLHTDLNGFVLKSPKKKSSVK